jgi:hypothetical protein
MLWCIKAQLCRLDWVMAAWFIRLGNGVFELGMAVAWGLLFATKHSAAFTILGPVIHKWMAG